VVLPDGTVGLDRTIMRVSAGEFARLRRKGGGQVGGTGQMVGRGTSIGIGGGAAAAMRMAPPPGT
jgi:hypothetical protein